MKKVIIGFGFFVLIIGVILIPMPFVYVLKIATESYQNPKSSVIISGSFVFTNIMTTRTTFLNTNDLLSIQVTVTSGENKDIDFSVNDGTITYLNHSRVATINEDWIVPLSSNYTFIFDNSYSPFTKEVTVQVTKHWNETAYRDVLTKNQLFPFEFTYLGIVLITVGSGLTIYGVVKKETRKSPIST